MCEHSNVAGERLSDLTSHCIRCGFCLEACPTFAITGQETESPRGRIYLIRSADEGVLDWDRQVKQHIDTCLGCVACETACPSGVEYGKIVELARDKLEQTTPHRTKHLLLNGMTQPARMKLQMMLGGLLPGKRIPKPLSRLLSGQPPEAEKPRAQGAFQWPDLPESELPPVRGEVYLLEGCVMRVLYPRVHEATRRLLRRVGFQVREAEQGCCGALHAHNGFLDDARTRAKGLIAQMPDDLPVIVNSAGCGGTLKHYDFLLGEESAGAAFSKRVFDASQFLDEEGLGQALEAAPPSSATVTYHDACHLAHAQKVRLEPRSLLMAVPGLTLVPLPESEMCCGSAGIYNVVQPKMARQLLERKWANVLATGASTVATGNPGCHAWIAQAAREKGANIQVLHTLEVLEMAASGILKDAR